MTLISGKYVTETSIDTDSDHMSPYGDIIVRHVLHLTAYYYYDHAVLIEYGRKEETVGRHAVEQLRGVGTFVLSWLYEKHIAIAISTASLN